MDVTIRIPNQYKERILEAFRKSQFSPPPGLTNTQLFEFVLARLIVKQVRRSETIAARDTVNVPNDLLTVIDIQGKGLHED